MANCCSVVGSITGNIEDLVELKKLIDDDNCRRINWCCGGYELDIVDNVLELDYGDIKWSYHSLFMFLIDYMRNKTGMECNLEYIENSIGFAGSIKMDCVGAVIENKGFSFNECDDYSIGETESIEVYKYGKDLGKYMVQYDNGETIIRTIQQMFRFGGEDSVMILNRIVELLNEERIEKLLLLGGK